METDGPPYQLIYLFFSSYNLYCTNYNFIYLLFTLIYLFNSTNSYQYDVTDHFNRIYIHLPLGIGVSVFNSK